MVTEIAALIPDYRPTVDPARTAHAAGGAFERQAQEAAQAFETLFLTQVLELTNTGLGSDNPFFGGPGERIFRSMLNQEIAGAVSRAGGFGIADAVYREIMRIQETSS